MDANEWYALREFVLRSTFSTEFGLVAASITCELFASVFVTAYFVYKVLILDHITDMLVGTLAYGIFAFMLWMYTLPLLGSAVATNSQLAHHRRYLSSKICRMGHNTGTAMDTTFHSSQLQHVQVVMDNLEVRTACDASGSADGARARSIPPTISWFRSQFTVFVWPCFQQYPLLLCIGGVPLTPEKLAVIKGYITMAATTVMGKVVTSGH